MRTFKQFVSEELKSDMVNLRRHTKWDTARYEAMKQKGAQHHQIQKVWDDEVEAERTAAQMSTDKSAGKTK